MKVIIKKPFEKPVVAEIEEGLKPLQQLVGGLTDNVYELTQQNINILVNDEGKIYNLEPNFIVYGGNDIVVGTAVFTGYDGEGNDISLTDEQIALIFDYLSGRCF